MKEIAKAPMTALVTHWDPKGSAAEAFRVLRTNLQFMGPDRPLRSLVVTSATPAEGKSFVASNLAIAYAQAGSRVCLVDADLRRPTLARLFGRENWVGLTTALVKNRSVREVTVETDIAGLTVLPSGPIPPNPVELLGSQKMQTLMSELTGQFDMVIYDSPPVLAVADPAVLGPRTDGVLLVLMAGRVGRDQARQARETLGNVKANLLGAVLDGLRARKHGGYGYYYYYYSSEREKK